MREAEDHFSEFNNKFNDVRQCGSFMSFLCQSSSSASAVHIQGLKVNLSASTGREVDFLKLAARPPKLADAFLSRVEVIARGGGEILAGCEGAGSVIAQLVGGSGNRP
jgi:hypothetical protein